LFQFKAAVDIGCDPTSPDARGSASVDVVRFQIKASALSPLLFWHTLVPESLGEWTVPMAF